MKSTTSTNWYDSLELSPSACPLLIKAAYRCLAQQHHPDKNPGVLDAGSRLVQINRAYAVLSDPQQRLVYDRSLGIVSQCSERRAEHSSVLAPLASGTQGMRRFAFRPLV
jgi:DnaJ-class molecular chaperone